LGGLLANSKCCTLYILHQVLHLFLIQAFQ
jgi:hypothetical protein